jgi:Ca-activated chloride channel family protein
MIGTRMRLGAGLCLAAVAIAPSPAAAQEGPAATIVLDGSGSMAGWLDGAKASKIDMTRAALAPLLGNVPPPGRVGLVAFGHRRKGNCTDVEAIVAPEPDGLAKTVAALPNVNPTGKGPLVQALRQAADGLGQGAPGQGRSIILVHDDADNCSQDACAAASDIAKAHPGLAIHVVTLGVKPQTRAAMACVAATTGGKQFEAGDEAALGAALTDVMKLAALDAVPAPKPAVRPSGPEAKLAEPGLVLSASLSDGGDVLAEKVRWRIAREDGGTPPEPLDVESPEFVQALPTGRYAVDAELGLARARQVIDVPEGKAATARFDLQAGRIVLAGAAGQASTGLMTLTRLQPQREPVFVGRVPTVPLVVPAGSYELRLDDGLLQQMSQVVVVAGQDVNVGRPTPTGKLELEAVSAENGPALDAVIYSIEKDDPDAPQGRREVARSAAARPDFTLPAGTYYVTARANQVEARQQLAISAGASVKHQLVLAMSRLTLAAKANASLSPKGKSLNFRVLSLDGSEREVARSAEVTPVLTVPAGRYRVEARLGTENARAVSDIEVQAAKDMQVTLDIAAGQVRLERGDAAGSDGIIEVADDSGNVVWHAGAGETATALLAPGRYKYRTTQGADKAFEVRNGERLTLRLGE